MEANTRNDFLLNGERISEISGQIKRKRPKTTQLDIEKLFQESIELTQMHKNLTKENQTLQKEYQKVQSNKANRQNFISAVEKLVKVKADEISIKNNQQTSWLVFNLNKKIYDLKSKINQKESVIRNLQFTKENQDLKKQQIQLDCLNEIIQYSKSENLYFEQSQEEEEKENLKQIFWIEKFLDQEKRKLIQLKMVLEQEDREAKKIMKELAIKKAQLKNIKEMQNEYVRAQENYQEEKKRKEQTLIGKKNYISDLIKKKEDEQKKLQNLKEKYVIIEKEENEQIEKLKQQLIMMENLFKQTEEEHQDFKFLKSTQSINENKREQWVKRVTVDEVAKIAKNMNYTLSIKKVTQQEWLQSLFGDQKKKYSIQELIEKFSRAPFNWEKHQEKKLLARYAVEDSDVGPIVEDMDRTQATPIIKSILMKLIGKTKQFSEEKIKTFYEDLGQKLNKFSFLIKQNIVSKEVGKKWITREELEEGIQNTELQISSEEIDFILVYLFSWARDIDQLEISKLGKLKELSVNWIQ